MAQWYLSMDTRFFIHISRDQPSAHEFTKYMGQQSLAPLLESALHACYWVHVVKFQLVGTIHFGLRRPVSHR